MATLTIRRLDDRTKAKLRVNAAHHGRSMEEEAREILRNALSAVASSRDERSMGEIIRDTFAPFGGVELEIPPRGPGREPPDFSK